VPMTHAEKAQLFHALHKRSEPLILFNIWDPGSARAVAKAGPAALATGSWSVASAFGYDDGEQVPFALVLNNLERVVRAVDLPVSADIETGYGATAQDVEASVAAVLARGVVGVNIEDGMVAGGLRPVAEQVERFRAAKAAVTPDGVRAFVNARIDVFLQNDPAAHRASLGEAIERMEAYAEAGADGLFLPGLVAPDLITQVCAATFLPVNLMVVAGTPGLSVLKRAGVSRLSYGPGPFVMAMAAIEERAKALFT
jgi:2-methylisocitrate lyase-like PEP mutase family enzyme